MIRVYRYGLRAPLDWPPEAEAEIERQRALWDRLVAIEAEYRAAVAAALDPDGALAALAARLAEAEAARDWPGAKAARAELAALRRERRRAHKDALAALEATRREAAKQARQASGCYWGNYNSVLQSYETARQRIDAGRALELRPSRPGGPARLTVQIQGGMSAADLVGGASSQIALSAPDARGWRMLTMVVAGARDERVSVVWPMRTMHRPLPEDAAIVGAQVTRTPRRGARWCDWHLCLTVREADAARPTDAGAGAVGVNIGWRRVEGGLRIATLDAGAGVEHVILPEAIIELAERCGELTAAVDRRIERTLAALDGAERARLQREADLRAQAHGRQCGRITPGQLAAAARATPELAACVRANVRDLRERAGLERRLVAARRDLYRCAARRIAAAHATVALADVDWSTLARRRDPQSLAPNPLPPPARGYRVIAAPGAFEAELRRAVAAAGGRIVTVDEAVTWRCHACGETAAGAHPERAVQRCPQGHVWDQDANAARNLLAAARASGAAAPESPDALAPAGAMGYEGRYQRARRRAGARAQALATGTQT